MFNIMKGFRGISAAIDLGIYKIIAGAFSVFFNISSSEIINGTIINDIFNRVQLIFGVVVLFRLAISLINGIVSPETVSNAKSGVGNILKRVVVSVLLMSIIVPLNIPDAASGSFEEKLNNNGILFGTLYEFQSRMIENNTLGTLILNTKTAPAVDDFNSKGNTFSLNILRTFIVPNVEVPSGMTEEEVRKTNLLSDKGQEYLACKSGEDVSKIASYMAENDIEGMLDNTGYTCGEWNFIKDNLFVFDYSMFISSIVGILILVMLLGFTIDIAIRAFKLAILRITSIGPIVSYIDTKNGDKNLSTWFSMLIKTYLDLFIRVGVLYIVVLFIDELFKNGGFLVSNSSSSAINTFSVLLVYIALFIFAKDAPKFILDSLGIKSDGTFFKNVGKFWKGAGAAGVGLAGGIAGGIAGFRASREASEAFKIMNPGQVRKYSGLKAAGSGLWTGLTGGINSGKDFYGSKSKGLSTSFNNARKRNTELMADGKKGVLMSDRIKSNLNLTGTDNYDGLKSLELRQKEELEDIKAKSSIFSTIGSMSESKAKISDKTFSYLYDYDGSVLRSDDGKHEMKFNYDKFMTQLNAAKATGRSTFVYDDGVGTSTFDVSSVTQSMQDEILDGNRVNYQHQVDDGSINDIGLKNYLDYAKTTYKDDFDTQFASANYQDAFYTDASGVQKSGFVDVVKKIGGMSKGDEFSKNNELAETRSRLKKAEAASTHNRSAK